MGEALSFFLLGFLTWEKEEKEQTVKVSNAII